MPQLDITENFADGTILTQAQLHQAFLDVEDFVNLVKLDEENIQAGSITAQSMADNSIITAKYQTASITLAKLAQDIVDKLVPSGAVSAFAGTAVPSGWLYCDGTAVSRTVYSALFAAIGIAHGNGDGSTTFNLPDIRGRFIRGQDNGAARDPYAASRTASNVGGNTGDNVGSVFTHVTALSTQTAKTVSGTTSGQSQNHSHTITTTNFAGNGGNQKVAGSSGNTGDLTPGSTSLANADHTHTFSATVVGGDAETAPISVYMRYIIKV